MKHGLVFLLSALALMTLSILLWDAYSEATGHPLLGGFAPLLFLLGSIIFLASCVSLALVLARGRQKKKGRRRLAPYFTPRASRRAVPPELLPSGMNRDPQAWDENENLPRGHEV